jgi:hypothetical protein
MGQVPDKSARGSADIEAFLGEAARVPAPTSRTRGRLIFALDATMSRQPTWDLAQTVQQQMFRAAGKLGGLDVQLVYFRGLFECRASRFVADGAGLGDIMSKIDCRGGNTQIGKVLSHVRDEAKAARVGAFVFIGDAMEENVDRLCAAAGELGLLGVKAFMFHEGPDRRTGDAFREIARLTGGAYAAFDPSAPNRLASLLGAAAAYAAGGLPALEAQAREGEAGAKLLIEQVRGKR